MTWKPLVYRGVDYGDFFEVSDEGHIKRKAFRKASIYGYIDFPARVYKPEKEFNVVIKPLKIRKGIDVKRAVAENFMPKDKKYHFVLRYDDNGGNGVDNIYWSNQPKKRRLPSSYNKFRLRKPELEREILQMYENGFTYDEIIKKFDITRIYIRNTLDAHGIKREQFRRFSKYSVDLEECKRLFEEGKSLRQVAEHFNISKYLASYYKGVLGFKAKTKILPLEERK